MLTTGRSDWMAAASNLPASVTTAILGQPRPAAATDKVTTALDRVAQYEDRVKAAARARIGADLAGIQAQFRAALALAAGDPAKVLAARRRAASSLRSLRPAVGEAIRGMVDEGVHLGASIAGGKPSKGARPLSDPAVKVTLAKANTPIRRHARLSANAVLHHPVNTEAQINALIDRIGAVITEVDGAALAVAARAVDVGTATVLDERGMGRVWVTRPGCCPVCASYAGSVAPPGGGFLPGVRYGDHEGQWEGPRGGIQGPPLHYLCRCVAYPEERGLAARVARRQQADVAAGRVAASMPARVRAVQRILAHEANLTQKTRERALTAAARGRTTGQRPATQRRTPNA